MQFNSFWSEFLILIQNQYIINDMLPPPCYPLYSSIYENLTMLILLAKLHPSALSYF